MQAAFAGGKVIAADWNGIVRVWTPDGKRVGDLDSNPPSVEQQLDAANKRVAALLAAQQQARDAGKRAAAALAAALEDASGAATALNASKAALTDAQNRLSALEKQSAAGNGTIQKTSGLDAAAGQMACASAANPLLEPALVSTLATQAAESQPAVAQSTLAAARARCAALARQVDAGTHARDAAEAGVKSTETALATAQAAEEKSGGGMNAANADLLKWRAAASRLASAPQLALRKTDSK